MSDLKDEAQQKEIEEEEAIETSETELETAKAQIAELQKSLIYLQAEFQNFRRRKEEEFVSQQKYVAANLLKELLPVADNLERALAAAEQSRSLEKLIGGVQGTQKQLYACLAKAGVSAIETVGKEFDPTFHEALGEVEGSELPPNTVVEELQRGYLLHDRVLRPALVKISAS